MREELKKMMDLADKLIETGKELKRQAYLDEGPGNAIALLEEIDLEEDFSWEVQLCGLWDLTAKPRSTRGQELFDSLRWLGGYIFSKHHGEITFYSANLAEVNAKLNKISGYHLLGFHGSTHEPILKCSLTDAQLIEFSNSKPNLRFENWEGIVEDMKLGEIKKGGELAEVICLPLRVTNGDGAPCSIIGVLSDRIGFVKP